MNISFLHASTVAWVLVASAVAGCSDASGPSKAGPPAVLVVVSGTPQDGESGEPLPIPLGVRVTDKNGRAVANVIVNFSISSGGGTLSASAATTDAEGMATSLWTMGPVLGAVQAEARVAGVMAAAIFNALVKPGPPAALQTVSPAIGSSAAGFEVLDSVAVKVVDRFNNAIVSAEVGFTVTAGGGTVSHATKVTGGDGIARTAWQLGTPGAQTLRASVGLIEAYVTGSAVTCSETQLAPGQIFSVAAGAPTCVLLSGSAQKFLVTVVNTTSSASASAGFRFRGAGSSTAALTPSTPVISAQFPSATYAASIAQERTQARAHAELLLANAELLDRLGPVRQAKLRSGLRALTQSTPLPNLGDVLTVNIPLNFGDPCELAGSAPIGGRVTYVGTRSVILEDTLAPLRGQNDAVYRSVGEEFDDVMWPVLTANYGNPLALDAELDGNGRIFMILSPQVNSVQGGTVAGFVSGGDLFSATDCPASNVGEYFYARVPTKSGGGFDTDNTTVTADEWLRSTRAVIMHESKHITSYAEKIASPDIIPAGFFPSDAWLEESTAMVAEELWARVVFGYAFRGNVDYAASVYCEVRPNVANCAGKPVAMFDHFYWLSQFAASPETKSPISAPSDFSVYGSGWLFVRWLLDQYATAESDILGPMTKDALRPGVANVEARVNRTFAQLIADWSLALTVDDYPGITIADPKHQLLSWNMRDIYSNLNLDFSGVFTQPFPLTVRTTGFGKFLIDVAGVQGGGMSVVEVSGTQSANQLFEFKGVAGTSFPAEMHINIVRVQ